MSGYRRLVEPPAFYQTVVPVSLDTVLAVQATGAAFALLICGSDQGSGHMEALLSTALQHQQPGVLALKVSVTNAEDAGRLSVIMVPQLRVYRGGQELARQRGTMDYGRLLAFLQKAVR
jgi:hypothetical protein